MRKRTTTQQLQNAITNNLLTIEKAEIHHKSSNHIDEISADKFKDSFDFLCESGVFAEAISWHYGYDCGSNIYILETGRMNPHSEIIITVYLKAGDGVVNREDVDKALMIDESEG